MVRKVLQTFHLDLTKNLEYDRLTGVILKKVLQPHSNCVDVGCHKGEILTEILKLAPQGEHHAFEPIPQFYKPLKADFPSVNIYPYALATSAGKSDFKFVENAPAYSGIKERDYAVKNPKIQTLTVELRRLDEVLTQNTKINLIKIDVEGAELGVLQGAEKTIAQNKPVIIFEFGKGASDKYGTEPHMIYDLLNGHHHLKINTLKNFVKNKPALKSAEFEKLYEANEEYYFIAYP